VVFAYSSVAHADRVLDAVEGRSIGSPAPGTPRYLSSWHRSLEQYRIDPASPVSPRILTAPELRQIQDREEAFLLASSQYLARLHEMLRGGDYCVLLANAQGVTVDYRVDPRLRKDYKNVGLYIGSCWSEQEEGTCGIGSALAERAPMTVHKVDHFRALFTSLTCTAAPILAPSGELIGVIDASALQSPDNAESQDLVYQLVRQSARFIEDGYFLNQTSHLWLLFCHASRDFVEVHPDLLIAFDDCGNIAAVNRRAKETIPGLQSGAPRNVSDLFDIGCMDLLTLRNPYEIRSLRLCATGKTLYARIRPPQRRASALPASQGLRRSATTNPGPMQKFLTSCDPNVARNAEIALRVAGKRLPILILGETGVGKEVFAQAIHASGERRSKPFIAVNCGAIPDSLIESELFGYAAGAFTGARAKGARGRIAQADGGTLFLDEIGDMPLDMQIRLLRVLAEGEVLPLGSDTATRVDLNVICATHRDLPAMVATGQFREDLYYRLSGAVLPLPALRERVDVEDVIRTVFDEEAKRAGHPLTLDAGLLARLVRHAWPGNVRQLRNVLRYACLICETPRVGSQHLPQDFVAQLDGKPDTVSAATVNARTNRPQADAPTTVSRPAPADERARIIDALTRHQWRATPAARTLGISRATLYRRIAQHGIELPDRNES
jgi:sigma-54 dependent transcriptional regulator, acetoin dehydrogenase operon transcriptional activator AcoR